MVNLDQSSTERYHELFQKLDINSDGKIDVNDLVFIFEKYKNDKVNNLKRAQVFIIYFYYYYYYYYYYIFGSIYLFFLGINTK
jgi:hypothetical protein